MGLACKAGGFAGGMIRKQRLRTTGRHFERANKGETGERKKEKGRGWGRGKRREEGGGGVWGCEEPPARKLGPSEFSVHGCAARCRGFAAFACARETQQYRQLRRLSWVRFPLGTSDFIFISRC